MSLIKRNNKGFTLAELLIVVAIIAVLVAVAIPTFGGQVERAREAADIANLRAAYAEATAAYLAGVSDNSNVKVDLDAKTVVVDKVSFSQSDDKWTGDKKPSLPFDIKGNTVPDKDHTKVTFDFSNNPVEATLE